MSTHKYVIRKSNRTRVFSVISSDDEFREYAHTVMKKAHGDEYSKEVTDKVVDDLLANNKGADYGELIGRLTSGFGDKSFSSMPKNLEETLKKSGIKYTDLLGDGDTNRAITFKYNNNPYCLLYGYNMYEVILIKLTEDLDFPQGKDSIGKIAYTSFRTLADTIKRLK